MAVQDLTPQLRTRLSRVERVVGLFVILATVLLLAGFAFYIYRTAESKGWFLIKVPYYTYLKNANGLRVGDPVRLMGFDVGEITEITAMPPEPWFMENNYNVFIKFVIKQPFYGYIWTDSRAVAGTGDLLGKRFLEVTRGSTGMVTVVESTNAPLRLLWDKSTVANFRYIDLTENQQGYWLQAVESPAITEQLDVIAKQVQVALPGIFDLTNRLNQVLSNSAVLAANAAQTTTDLKPILTNLTMLTANLTNNQPGALGEWLIPTNINQDLSLVLTNVNRTLVTSETKVAQLSDGLMLTLLNVANITSNLNTQVQSNDQILSEISSLIVNADNMIQGLKRHWLLRSAFKEKKTSPGASHSPARTNETLRPIDPKQGKRGWKPWSHE